jgi:beta-galactosidase/beta-glucuronidase
VATVEGSWEVAFQPDRGAPPKITLDKLMSWTDSSDDGVKYFSGTATYTKTLNAPESWFKSGTRLWIDLGDVKNLAEVSVNGKALGIVWKTPYRVDATSAVKQGANRLQIKVTNGWVNRIIGDRQPNAPQQYTLTVPEFYRPTAPLWASGLIGPVQMIQTSTASAK